MRHRIGLLTLSLIAAFAVVITGFLASDVEAQGANYRIRSGDVLSIEVLEDPSLSREVLILPDGRFSFPFAGSVLAGGRTTDQVAANLSSGIASNFAAPPNVFVSVRQLRPQVEDTAPTIDPVQETINIYLVGEVNAPGLKTVLPGSSLLQALSTSGGFTTFAALRRLQLRRTDPATGRQTVTTINYRALSNGAELSRDIILAEGDVILVPQRRLFE